jgi:hypothetical protein
MIRKTLAVGAAATALTIPLVIVTASPAAALATPLMSVTVQTFNGGFRACAYGSSAGALVAVSLWDFEVAGTTVPIQDSVGGSGSAFYSQASPACIYVWKLDHTAGAFTATLTFVSDGTDLSRSVVGTGRWNPAEEDNTTSMRTCGGAPC